MIPSRDPAAVRFGPFLYEPINGRLLRAGIELGVPPRALAILGCLVEHPGLLVTKQALLDQVWKDAFVTDTSLSEAVSVLRQALGDDAQEPSYVQTVPRRGYRFIADVAPAADAAAAAASASGSAARSLEAPASAASNAATALDAPLWMPWAPWLACFVAGLGVGVLSLALQAGPSIGDAPLARFTVPLPAGLALSGPSALALSGDGRVLAAVLEDAAGRRAVYTRPLDSGTFQPIPGSEDARLAFVSPDGERVGMWIADRVRAVHLRAGTWTTLATARLLRGATWTDDGSLWLASEADGALRRVTTRGGAPVTIVRPRHGEGEAAYEAPVRVGSSGLVFAAVRPGQEPLLYGWPESASTPRPLGPGATPQWVAPAHLVFRRGDRAQAALLLPPDWTLLRPTTLARVGRVDPLVPFAATAGTMARPPGCRDCDMPLVSVAGAPPVVVAVPGGGLDAWLLSMDGARIVAISRVGDDRQVWRVAVDRVAPLRLDRGAAFAVAADPSAARVAIAAHERGAWTVRVADPEGSAAPRLVHTDVVPVTPSAIAPSGVVWMHKSNARGDLDLWSLAPGAPARVALATGSNEWHALPSPDGRYLAHLTDARGDVEVVVRDLPSGRTLGAWPADDARWAPDGGHLLLRNGRGWRAVAPAAASSPANDGTWWRAVDPSPALTLPALPSSATTLDIVLQWAREVRQQVPVAPRPLPVVR